MNSAIVVKSFNIWMKHTILSQLDTRHFRARKLRHSANMFLIQFTIYLIRLIFVIFLLETFIYWSYVRTFSVSLNIWETRDLRSASPWPSDSSSLRGQNCYQERCCYDGMPDARLLHNIIYPIDMINKSLQFWFSGSTLISNSRTSHCWY